MKPMEGLPLFLLSTSCFFALRSQFSTSVSKDLTENDLSYHNEEIMRIKSIPRVESEFSLGLNRSESIGNQLNEYGELCQSGQWAILGLKTMVIFGAGYFIVSKITINNK